MEIVGSGVLPALLLSVFAGMSTAIGSLFAFFSKRSNERFLSFALGFSAGVMILISFCELLPDSRASLAPVLGARMGGAAAAISLIFGLAVAMLINRLIPSYEDSGVKAAGGGQTPVPALTRMGIVTALAVTIHNFPEGIATFMAGYADIRLGLPVAISIALHNIPEGISVSVPIYYGTGSRIKAFTYSALSGLSEPAGALLAYLIFGPFINGVTLGAIFGAVAGIMIYISFDGLIPASQQYGYTGMAVAGIFLGVVFMQAAFWIFGL